MSFDNDKILFKSIGKLTDGVLQFSRFFLFHGRFNSDPYVVLLLLLFLPLSLVLGLPGIHSCAVQYTLVADKLIDIVLMTILCFLYDFFSVYQI